MSEKYFNKFPLITYNNQLAVNITERVVVRDFPANNAFLYYPYDIQNYERPDQLADRILNDEYMSWIIYLSNGITDPYYDWVMTDEVFNAYLMKKYGDVDKITAKTAYYRNNWYNDSNVITVSEFDSLPDIPKYDTSGNLYFDTAKRYYELVLTGSNITAYKRKKIDDVIHTNKIVRYAVTGNSAFTNNEIVNIQLGYANTTTNTFVSTVSGNAQILSSNSSTVTVQHTTGYVDTVQTGYIFSTTSSYIYGTESEANCAVTSYTSLANNIVAEEAIYWSPVTIYEDEFERNAKNRTIRILDPARAGEVAQAAADTLAGLL
jgi:disulfide oxidoreductase YuzD